MVTLILGKTLVAWSGWLAGIFFFGGLLARVIINKSNLDIEKKKKRGKYLFRLSIIFILIHVALALLSSLFGIYL